MQPPQAHITLIAKYILVICKHAAIKIGLKKKEGMKEGGRNDE
jgi:hypothetical protein